MKTMRPLSANILLLTLAFIARPSEAQNPGAPARAGVDHHPIRVGIIGLDTSHVTAFTKILHDASSPDHVPGARVVAGYPGGSPDVKTSITRVEKFTAELRDKWNVEIVKDIPSLLSKVDAVLLESVDGRVHLEQVRPVLAARKRVFIDKPMAASYRDAKEIARLAKQAGVPWWSSSSLRYAPGLPALKSDAGILAGAESWGPASLEPTNPGLFWYGIHASEMLYVLMGTGCEEVTDIHTEGADVVVGRWNDGRLGVVRGIRKGKSDYGAVAFGEKSVQHLQKSGGALYKHLLAEIVKFFQTGVPPVPNDETIELMAFMEAAELSRKRGGVPVKLSEVGHR